MESLVITIGLGFAFLSYYIYYERKSQSYLELNKKIIEKTMKQTNVNKNSSKYPDLNDEKAIQSFFMRDVKKFFTSLNAFFSVLFIDFEQKRL